MQRFTRTAAPLVLLCAGRSVSSTVKGPTDESSTPAKDSFTTTVAATATATAPAPAAESQSPVDIKNLKLHINKLLLQVESLEAAQEGAKKVEPEMAQAETNRLLMKRLEALEAKQQPQSGATDEPTPSTTASGESCCPFGSSRGRGMGFFVHPRVVPVGTPITPGSNTCHADQVCPMFFLGKLVFFAIGLHLLWWFFFVFGMSNQGACQRCPLFPSCHRGSECLINGKCVQPQSQGTQTQPQCPLGFK